jgi:PAS domain S-box-containing protein
LGLPGDGAATAEELLGKTDFDYVPLEQAQNFSDDDQAVMRSGQPLIDREEQVTDHVTGEIRWYSTTKVPLRDAHGNIAGIVGIGRNISARKQTEQALRLRNRAIESSVNAVLITDFATPGNPIEYVNPAFERITGYSAKDALGRNINFLLAQEQEQAGVEEIRAALVVSAKAAPSCAIFARMEACSGMICMCPGAR